MLKVIGFRFFIGPLIELVLIYQIGHCLAIIIIIIIIKVIIIISVIMTQLYMPTVNVNPFIIK